jgi:hypothetical protein
MSIGWAIVIGLAIAAFVVLPLWPYGAVIAAGFVAWWYWTRPWRPGRYDG